MSPVEPPPTPWNFPEGAPPDEHGLVAVGADLAAGTLLAAYRRGLFPMPLGAHGPLGWWSPDPRGILPLDGMRISRSLRRSSRRYEVRVDTAFEAVIDGCGDPSRKGGWITAEIRAAYVRLHHMGWAHSIEAWNVESGELAGGLYGVAIAGLFAAESKFHHETDASKVALVGLVEILRDSGGDGRLIDVQWLTPHLATLGVIEVPADRYLALLGAALRLPLPEILAGDHSPSGDKASTV